MEIRCATQTRTSECFKPAKHSEVSDQRTSRTGDCGTGRCELYGAGSPMSGAGDVCQKLLKILHGPPGKTTVDFKGQGSRQGFENEWCLKNGASGSIRIPFWWAWMFNVSSRQDTARIRRDRIISD